MVILEEIPGWCAWQHIFDSIVGSVLFLKLFPKTCRKWILFKPRKGIQVSGFIFRIPWVLRSNLYNRGFCSEPCVTRAYLEPLVYSKFWYILKSRHIQISAEYLRWNILLGTLFDNSKFRAPIYSKLSHIQNPSVSATP